MLYVSSRNKAKPISFEEVLLSGLATDGGLYMPKNWPTFEVSEIATWRDLSYPELALKIIKPFMGGIYPETILRKIVFNAYASFSEPDVIPVKSLDDGIWIMELFHGPTMAFKDVAMQFLGHLFDHVLKKNGKRITIVGATSGDTGSAAIEACRNKSPIEIFMLHPKNRISEIQRRQMTTIIAPNVHNIALAGNFDDCQDLVKEMFNDKRFRNQWQLSAVNSINWARIMSQTVYYFWASLKLGGPNIPISFSIPTGNFGNIFAGYTASRMGLPIERLVIASNKNDILTRLLETGKMTISTVKPSVSPSMDIQISSNFERLLFECVDRDGDFVKKMMAKFRKTGEVALTDKVLLNMRELFSAACVSDKKTKDTIANEFRRHGYTLDPHSAVGLAAAREIGIVKHTPMVILATAHPAKFPDPIESATGRRPKLPKKFQNLLKKEERVDELQNNFVNVKSYIESKLDKKELR